MVTIGEIDFGDGGAPSVRVVEHYRWTGEPQHALVPALADLLKRTWRCRRVAVDATGLGAGVASGLAKAMGGAVEPFVFTAGSKSSAGLRSAGGGEHRAAVGVRGGRLGGVRGVPARDGAGASAVPPEPDDGLLRGAVEGARRLPDERGAAGAGGVEPASGGTGEAGGRVRVGIELVAKRRGSCLRRNDEVG